MRDIEEILKRLRTSEFRSRISLRPKELDYLRSRGMETVIKHAGDFIAKRVAPAEPSNDGKQTPWRNHPVFLAQHATATCCRECLDKWHGIRKGKELTEEEQRYIVDVIKGWLSQYEAAETEDSASTRSLTQANAAICLSRIE